MGKRRVFSSRSLVCSVGSRRSRSRSAAIRSAELLSCSLPALRLVQRRQGKLGSFSFQYQRFPLGPRSGPVFWNGCPVAQLQGGVPNLGGFALVFPALFGSLDRGS